MVRVLRCHHFSSQDVFTTENEPLRMFATDSLAFVATDQCYIEVHDITKPGSPMLYKFPTVAPVLELVYSEADDFIATLEEEKPSMSGPQTAVRVYLNWRTDLTSQPMRAMIAGHMTSLRHRDGDGTRFEVVEIPLKGNPKSISVDKTFGALAIAIGQNLLVYGFCTKVEAETKTKHKDIKCLLDLEFSFEIHKLAIAEDYMAVCSETEVQVVVLKTPTCPGPDIENCPVRSRSEIFSQKDKENSSPVNCNHDTPVRELLAFENRSTYTPSPSQSSIGTNNENNTGKSSKDYIIDDEYFINWSFQNGGDTLAVPIPQRTTKISSVAAASANALRTIVLKGIATVQGKKSKAVRLPNSGELLGPVDNPLDCPVSVEYEDVCDPSCSKRGHVSTGVRTCLYRKFDPMSSKLHSLQLIPVYLHASHTRRSERGGRCCVFCPISEHESLVGMSMFVSDTDEGYLYNVHGSALQLATYPYTKPAKQVSLSDQLLYVATSRGLEVYTSRCGAYALHNVSPVDGITNALPPADLEPCLVGLQPFIGAEFVHATDKKVLLLSKWISSSKARNAEASWSLYVLHCQKVYDLYKDMTDLGKQHQLSSPPTSLQLLQEGQLLLRTHQFKYGTNESSIHNLIKESATFLAEYYSCQENEEWSLTLPYCLISGLSLGEVIHRVVGIRRASGLSDQYGKGLMVYLDYMLFRQENAILCTQNEADMVLKIYAAVEPASISTVILKSTLPNYTNETALEILTKRRSLLQTNNKNNLDILALAVLYMRLGQLHDAETSVLSLTPTELLNTCTSNPWLLHEDYSHFSHISQMLRKHQRKQFMDILISLLEQNVFRLDNTISMLQGNSTLALYENQHIREYLEGILSSSERANFFPDSARRLIEIYLGSLRNWCPPTSIPNSSVNVRDIIPKGSGHFTKRFNWLDYFPPFEGPRSLTKPCKLLLALRSGQSRESSQMCGMVETPVTNKAKEACTCCTCNAELLKLQSLLCSSFTPHETLHLLLSELKASPDMRGSASLHVLCQARLDPRSAVGLITDQFPHILPHFIQEMLDSDTDVPMWKHIVKLLVEKLKAPLEDAEKETYEATFKSVLAYMSEVLPPNELVPLLPDEDSTNLYQPYVQRSHERQRAQQLKAIIIERAKEFKTRPS